MHTFLKGGKRAGKITNVILFFIAKGNMLLSKFWMLVIPEYLNKEVRSERLKLIAQIRCGNIEKWNK
ncbi:uncharacterized protein LOC100747054 [Bombus impatiens]|uniref:Uncharacterized protein LOC100747054 n=1 Tax=Bombus impatiens TaxID=132113 RepID=A0A6P8LTK2_BOMIM|nr:uncharacterized protein LOC100747054 [Bombus impatiens]